MRLFGAGAATAAKGVHLALVAGSRAAVDAFYAAAVARSLPQIAGNLLGGVGEAGSTGLQVDAGCPGGEADRVVPPAQQESVE